MLGIAPVTLSCRVDPVATNFPEPVSGPVVVPIPPVMLEAGSKADCEPSPGAVVDIPPVASTIPFTIN